jgi:hypothetical protein
MPASFASKLLRKKMKSYLQEPLLNFKDGLILLDLTGPPSQVSQVEIEAGDSEGRLPFVFLFVLCGSSLLL